MSWWVGPVEGARGWGQEQMGGVPVENSMVEGTSIVFW